MAMAAGSKAAQDADYVVKIPELAGLPCAVASVSAAALIQMNIKVKPLESGWLPSWLEHIAEPFMYVCNRLSLPHDH